MVFERDSRALAAEKIARRPGRKPKELFYRAEAEALAERIRDEFRGSKIAGLVVRYVCRNDPSHSFEERAVSYNKEHVCVYCDCLMSANVVKEASRTSQKEPTCTEPQ
jgi:hypothetical protein